MVCISQRYVFSMSKMLRFEADVGANWRLGRLEWGMSAGKYLNQRHHNYRLIKSTPPKAKGKIKSQQLQPSTWGVNMLILGHTIWVSIWKTIIHLVIMHCMRLYFFLHANWHILIVSTFPSERMPRIVFAPFTKVCYLMSSVVRSFWSLWEEIDSTRVPVHLCCGDVSSIHRSGMTRENYLPYIQGEAGN